MKTLKSAGEKRRPINLFFTELIIALLFFSISGAVILKLFAAADRKSRLSSVKENAMVCAQAIAEAYSVYGAAADAFDMVFSELPEFDGERHSLTLDKLCRPDVGGSVLFTASETVEDAGCGELRRLSLEFSSDSEVLFSLSCTAYSEITFCEAEDSSDHEGGDGVA